MSIFPKRALQGDCVTIHWNFNTAKLKGTHRFPLVRIGVKNPLGLVTMLFEQHVLALPAIEDEQKAAEEKQLLYLNKNMPLLMVASYLSGRYTKEKLVDILENIQAGRHYYFSYVVPKDAPLGKYSLISEVIGEGHVQYSSTADDDFFYIEKVGLSQQLLTETEGTATICNFSTESVPIKIVEYYPHRPLLASDIRVFEIPGSAKQDVIFHSPYTYLVYNEEREMIPMGATSALVSRNPYFLSLEKKEENSTYLFNREGEEGHVLEGAYEQIWHHANGLNSKQKIIETTDLDAYQQMLDKKLIKEIIRDEHR